MTKMRRLTIILPHAAYRQDTFYAMYVLYTAQQMRCKIQYWCIGTSIPGSMGYV